VPQGSKVGPTDFIIKINNLPAVIRDEMSRIMATSSEACAIIEDDTIMNRIEFICTQKIYNKIIKIKFYMKENGAGELE
jgi:DNA-directed RNA polymerase subunit E'/Rpb7